jgi:hypothetical protein
MALPQVIAPAVVRQVSTSGICRTRSMGIPRLSLESPGSINSAAHSVAIPSNIGGFSPALWPQELRPRQQSTPRRSTRFF